MRVVLLVIILSVLGVELRAGGEIKYPVASIPNELLKDVNAVVREDHMVYTILAKNSARCRYHFVVTVLNKEAEHFAEKTLFYDKFSKIASLSASVYDAAGKQIKKLKKNEIYDQAAFGDALFSDHRLKAINLTHALYPYTVEIDYEMEYDYLYAIDGSIFISEERVSVENASYTLVYPPNLAPRYKTFNISSEPSRTLTPEGNESLKWSLQKLLPIELEPYSDERQVFPQIIVAPSVFEYDDYAGDMSSWENYGAWLSQLSVGKDNLSESTIAKVKEITSSIPDVEGKVKALYEYMQKKTRYVNISLGIGGLQPFDAAVVDQMGYGDCKALSNYMVTILKHAGIKAYYTIVMAGKNAPAVMTDFPSHQANHVIVAVPTDSDTLWLECTSQTNPFGYMGTFTGNRTAMMLTENGGVLVKTPSYNADDNTLVRVADVTLQKTGNASAVVKSVYKAFQYETDHLNFYFNNPEKQKKWIEENTFIPSFVLNAYEVREQREKIPSAIVTVELDLKRLASVSDKRIFLTPNLMNRNTYVPKKVLKRKTEVELTYPYTDLDTIKYHIPEEIYPEFLPEPIKITSPFGSYEASFTLDAGSLLYVRKLRRNAGTFPAESYNQLIEFYRSITKADNTKVVFLSKT